MIYGNSAVRPKVDGQRAKDIAREVLGQCFAFTEAHGPNGPWYIESVTIRRYGNTILIYDVDGQLAESYEVEDFTVNHPETSPVKGLLKRIEEVNERTLEAL